MTWDIGNHGFQMTLKTSVPDFLMQYLPDFIKTQAIDIGAIDALAVHPGGKKILHAVEKSLGLPREKNIDAHRVLAHYGNMSSATIWFVWKSLLDRTIDEQNIFSMAFGPGLSVEYNMMTLYP